MERGNTDIISCQQNANGCHAKPLRAFNLKQVIHLHVKNQMYYMQHTMWNILG